MTYKKFILFILVTLVVVTNILFSETPKEKPYIILISFDGFRWDYTQRDLTPNLQKMADNGVAALSLKPVFPSKTFPNHYSIITGMYPENHGIIHNDFVDFFTGRRYKVGDTTSVRESKWYTGEAFWETAERQSITTASYFWPGSEVNLSYRRSTYVEYYEHERPYETRVAGVLNWLKLPEEKRPHFITLYFDATDTYGHEYGPDSPEINWAIQRLDNILGMLLSGLEEMKFLHKTNIIVISDHGMTSVDGKRLINIEKILSGNQFNIQGYGPVMMLDCMDEDKNLIYKKLQKQQANFDVYLRENLPEFYHFSNHPFISPLILIANMGWTLVNNEIEAKLINRTIGGNHGYDNHHLDMHGIFYAMGPAFKKGYRSGTVWNIDIYPLLCNIFKIFPRQNIDGKLERIEFILKAK